MPCPMHMLASGAGAPHNLEIDRDALHYIMEDNKFVDKLAPLQDLWVNILENGRQGVEI